MCFLPVRTRANDRIDAGSLDQGDAHEHDGRPDDLDWVQDLVASQPGDQEGTVHFG